MKTKQYHSEAQPPQELRTPSEARALIDFQGISVAAWARERGFSASLVHQILKGRKRCRHGQSHNIAVALGIKAGVPAAPTSRTRAEKQGAAA